MWSPTHVQVTVVRARNLKIKGKSGTNDAYVSIRFGKEKYQTSVQERTTEPVWNEKCQFPLDDASSTGVVRLKVFHRNLLGKDDLLGSAEVKIQDIDVHERTRSRWYRLVGKDHLGAGGANDADGPDQQVLGEIECVVYFYVENLSGSQFNLSSSLHKSNKRFSFKRSQGDKPVFKWPNRPSISISGKSRDKKEESTANNEVVQKEPNNNLVQEIDRGDEESVSDSQSGSRKDSCSTYEDDTNLDHRARTDSPDIKHKKGFLADRIASIKSKNKNLKKMGALSQSTLGINIAREGSFNSSRGERFMRAVPFLRSSLSDDKPKAEREVLKESSEYTATKVNEIPDNDVLESNEKSNKKSDSNSDLKPNGSTSHASVSEKIKEETKKPEVEEQVVALTRNTSGKTKRRAPLPSDLNPTINVTTASGTVCNDFKENGVDYMSKKEADENHKPTTPLELEFFRNGKEEMGKKEDKGSDTDSNTSGSRPSSPPVISIRNNRKALVSHADENTTLGGASGATAPDDDDDVLSSRLGSTVTQTQPVHNDDSQELSPQILLEFYNYSRNDLIRMIVDQQRTLQKKDAHIADLETYIDNLIVKVIDLQPKLLLSPSESNNESNNVMMTSSSPGSRDARSMTLPAGMKPNFTGKNLITTKKTEKISATSVYGKLVRSASTKEPSDKKRSPFRAIQAVLR